MVCSSEGRACDLSLELNALTNINILCGMTMSTMCLDKANDAIEIQGLVREFMDVTTKLSIGEVFGPLGKLDLFGHGKRLLKKWANLTRSWSASGRNMKIKKIEACVTVFI